MIAVLVAACLATSQIHVELAIPDEPLRPAFERYAADANKRIVGFFGSPFKKDITLHVLPNRKAFDDALHQRWKMEPTQPWMVGAAGADVLFVLSPRVWKTEAQEHNPDDAKEIAEIVCHELVHCYHSQINPSRELEGLDAMAWYVEGLPTYVSGQLERSHNGIAEREVKAGRIPARLEDAWTGRGRYAIAGSMVRFVDEKFGRSKVIELLKATTNAAAMKALGTTEEKFLSEWKQTFSLDRISEYEKWLLESFSNSRI